MEKVLKTHAQDLKERLEQEELKVYAKSMNEFEVLPTNDDGIFEIVTKYSLTQVDLEIIENATGDHNLMITPRGKAWTIGIVAIDYMWIPY